MAIYMNFNGFTPKGNVTAEGYTDGWIEVDSFNFGVGRGITMEAGAMANREATRPSVSEITITKRLDSASGGLFKSSVTGDEGCEVIIDLVQTGADKVEKYASYKLEDCIISSYSISASIGSAPTEAISISFARIEANLAHADKANKNAGQEIVGYDLTLGKPV